MKSVLYVVLVCLSFSANAQKYQCFVLDTVNFFVNGNGYLRGMRIDSAVHVGTDVFYFPYRTPRGEYQCWPGSGVLDSNGGSWLGKKVIQHDDGTFLFDNIWKDTTVIKTQAQLGDSWIFFSDSTDLYYIATVTEIDTMTVLGVIDSVKKITIVADSAGTPYASDPVNNFQIIISKNYGFVQIFDLYTFPYHKPGFDNSRRQFFDYYLDLVLGNLGTADLNCFLYVLNMPDTINSVFNLVPFHNPTKREIYDFAAGDVYQSNDYHYLGVHGYTSTMILDSVLTRTSTPYSISTSGIEITNTTNMSVSGTSLNYTYSNTRGAFGSTGDTAHLFSFKRLPEETYSGYFLHYTPHGSIGIGSCSTAIYTVDADNISYAAWRVIFQQTDFNYMIDYSNVSYGIGYGSFAASDKNYQFDNSRTRGYNYVLKDGVECGTYIHPVSVENYNAEVKNVEIFPNPVSDVLNIRAATIIGELTICNLLGQILFERPCYSRETQLNISFLSPGIYFIKINGTVVRKFIKS